MFHDLREPMQARMRYLERVQRLQVGFGRSWLGRLVAAVRRAEAPAPEDPELVRRARDLPHLNQVPPATGKLLALLAAGAPEGAWLEIGTSGGYSAMWLSLACELRGRTLTTFELLPAKVALARETFREAQIEGVVTLVEGDARALVVGHDRVAFCFLDAAKEIYGECYEAVVPRLVPGGLLVADNVISHRHELATFAARAFADARVDALQVPIGTGVLICRKQ